jgi:hypothetical protein
MSNSLSFCAVFISPRLTGTTSVILKTNAISLPLHFLYYIAEVIFYQLSLPHRGGGNQLMLPRGKYIKRGKKKEKKGSGKIRGTLNL